MKVEYDPKHGLMNIEFIPKSKIVDSIEREGIIFDYGKGGKIVSIEILDVSKRIGPSPIDKINFSVALS